VVSCLQLGNILFLAVFDPRLIICSCCTDAASITSEFR
jgi:hypothetical protein